jgi:CelD/BcsL family acetyltransferase involved in cellulose biosynthesis
VSRWILERDLTRMQVEIIRETGAFMALGREWNELLSASSSDCAFLTFEWLSTWWRHFHAGRPLCVMTVRSGGELVAIAPFVRCRWRVRPPRLVSALEFMGYDAVGSEYLDIIVRTGREATVADVLGDALANEGVMLDLAQLREGQSMARLLESGLAQRRWLTSGSFIGPCRFIPLEGCTWDGYLAGLGSQHRSNVRRRLRGVEKTFEVHFDAVTREEERSEALRTLIRLHNDRWKERGSSMAFRTPAQLAFHDDVTRLFLERGWLRFFTLRLDGEAVASLYGFTYKRKFYFYQSGFNPLFSRHSVGLVTMALTIQEAIKERVEEFDMLYGFESYKAQWAPACRGLVGLEFCPRDFRGHLHRASVRARDILRPVRRMIRAKFGPGKQPGDVPPAVEA